MRGCGSPRHPISGPKTRALLFPLNETYVNRDEYRDVSEILLFRTRKSLCTSIPFHNLPDPGTMKFSVIDIVN
jgi:hypothetical protein